MKIGLDFDGVIADSITTKTLVAEKVFGVKFSPDICKREIVVKQGLLSDDQYTKLSNITYENPEWMEITKPVVDFLVTIPKLANSHSLVVITSRGDNSATLAKNWLAKYNINLPLANVGPKNSKNQAAVGLDVFVDDDLPKLVELVGVVPKLYLFSWKYNQHEVVPAGIERVSSWVELTEKINSSSFGSD